MENGYYSLCLPAKASCITYAVSLYAEERKKRGLSFKENKNVMQEIFFPIVGGFSGL